jgi:hypothetical protein
VQTGRNYFSMPTTDGRFAFWQKPLSVSFFRGENKSTNFYNPAGILLTSDRVFLIIDLIIIKFNKWGFIDGEPISM